MIQPVRERAFQRRFQCLFDAGLRRDAKDRQRGERTFFIALRQMITARRLAQTTLAQYAGIQQATGKGQNVLRFTGQQFQLQFTNRLLVFTGFDCAAVERDFNFAIAFLYNPSFTRKISAEKRLYVLCELRRQFSLRPDLSRQFLQRQLRRVQRNVVFRTLMQAADDAPGDFQRHFIASLVAANAQPHVVAAQPVIRRFIVNIQQLTRGRMLCLQRVEVLTQRVNAILSDDKL